MVQLVLRLTWMCYKGVGLRYISLDFCGLPPQHFFSVGNWVYIFFEIAQPFRPFFYEANNITFKSSCQTKLTKSFRPNNCLHRPHLGSLSLTTLQIHQMSKPKTSPRAFMPIWHKIQLPKTPWHLCWMMMRFRSHRMRLIQPLSHLHLRRVLSADYLSTKRNQYINFCLLVLVNETANNSQLDPEARLLTAQGTRQEATTHSRNNSTMHKPCTFSHSPWNHVARFTYLPCEQRCYCWREGNLSRNYEPVAHIFDHHCGCCDGGD